jgi:hypothetical protein
VPRVRSATHRRADRRGNRLPEDRRAADARP